MTKHFEKNKNGKIEFTEKELKNLLDEIYLQGMADGKQNGGYWWSSPSVGQYLTCDSTGGITWADPTNTITVSGNNNLNGTVNIDKGFYSSLASTASDTTKSNTSTKITY